MTQERGSSSADIIHRAVCVLLWCVCMCVYIHLCVCVRVIAHVAFDQVFISDVSSCEYNGHDYMFGRPAVPLRRLRLLGLVVVQGSTTFCIGSNSTRTDTTNDQRPTTAPSDHRTLTDDSTGVIQVQMVHHDQGLRCPRQVPYAIPPFSGAWRESRRPWPRRLRRRVFASYCVCRRDFAS